MTDLRPDEFWAQTTPEPNTGCLLWTGGGDIYGHAMVNGKRAAAHRIALWLATGREAKPGQHTCHRCHTKGCVRPDHLYIGTPKQNAADMKSDPLRRWQRRVRKWWNVWLGHQWRTLDHRSRTAHACVPGRRRPLCGAKLTPCGGLISSFRADSCCPECLALARAAFRSAQ